jgi:hypothetical protein
MMSGVAFISASKRANSGVGRLGEDDESDRLVSIVFMQEQICT